jgi:hypothetical protein
MTGDLTFLGYCSSQICYQLIRRNIPEELTQRNNPEEVTQQNNVE